MSEKAPQAGRDAAAVMMAMAMTMATARTNPMHLASNIGALSGSGSSGSLSTTLLPPFLLLLLLQPILTLIPGARESAWMVAMATSVVLTRREAEARRNGHGFG